jgi:cyanophycinase
LKSTKGALVIIGGAENRTGDGRVLREFVRLSGGLQSRIAVIAVASDYPVETAMAYKNLFETLGAAEVVPLEINERNDSNLSSCLDVVQNSTGIFFTGGNQSRITQLLGGTRLDDLLHDRQEDEGLVIAGTSAGAAMMSNVMIGGGLPEHAFYFGNVELRPGMNFMQGVIIDQHFEQRGRLRRLLAAVAQYPRDLGIGIDEDTAIVVEENKFRVIGEGTVTVIDATDLSYTNLPDLSKDELLTLFNVKVHVLAEGYGYDLYERLPLVH